MAPPINQQQAANKLDLTLADNMCFAPEDLVCEAPVDSFSEEPAAFCADTQYYNHAFADLSTFQADALAALSAQPEGYSVASELNRLPESVRSVVQPYVRAAANPAGLRFQVRSMVTPEGLTTQQIYLYRQAATPVSANGPSSGGLGAPSTPPAPRGPVTMMPFYTSGGILAFVLAVDATLIEPLIDRGMPEVLRPVLNLQTAITATYTTNVVLQRMGVVQEGAALSGGMFQSFPLFTSMTVLAGDLMGRFGWEGDGFDKQFVSASLGLIPTALASHYGLLEIAFSKAPGQVVSAMGYAGARYYLMRGLGSVTRAFSAAGVALLLNYAGDLYINWRESAHGADDEPMYQLMKLARDQHTDGFTGGCGGYWGLKNFFVCKPLVGVTSLFAGDELAKHSYDKAQEFVHSGEKFAEWVTDSLVFFAMQSTYSNANIDWSQASEQDLQYMMETLEINWSGVEREIGSLYRDADDNVKNAYALFKIGKGEIPQGQRLNRLIGADGRVLDSTALQQHVIRAVRNKLVQANRNLERGLLAQGILVRRGSELHYTNPNHYTPAQQRYMDTQAVRLTLEIMQYTVFLGVVDRVETMSYPDPG